MTRRTRKDDGIPRSEWIAGIASLLLVLGTLGYLAMDALRSGEQFPDLRLQTEAIRQTETGQAAIVVVRNMSPQTAAEVIVEGAIGAGNSAVRSEARLDYVPGRSERRVVLVFPTAVPLGDLRLRVLGYTRP